MQSLQKHITAVIPTIENPGKNAIALTEAAKKYTPKQPIISGVTIGGDKRRMQKRMRAGYLKWGGGNEASGKQVAMQHLVMFNSGIVEQKALRSAPDLLTGAKSRDSKVTKTEIIPNAEIASIAARLQAIMLAIGDMAMGFAMGGTAGMATTVLTAAVNGIEKWESGFAGERRNHPLLSGTRKDANAPAVGVNQVTLAVLGTRSLAGILPEQRSSFGLSSVVRDGVSPMSSMAFNSNRKHHYFINVQRRAAAISTKSALLQGNDRVKGTAGKLQTTPNKAAQIETMRVVSISEKLDSKQLLTMAEPTEGRSYPGRRYEGNTRGGELRRPWSKSTDGRQNHVERSVHIHLDKPLIERFTIEVKDAKEGLSDFKRKVEEVLLDILNSANLIK